MCALNKKSPVTGLSIALEKTPAGLFELDLSAGLPATRRRRECSLRCRAPALLAALFRCSSRSRASGRLLPAAGARVELYAHELCEKLRQLIAEPPRGAIVWRGKAWTPRDWPVPRSQLAHSRMTKRPRLSPPQRAPPAFRSTSSTDRTSAISPSAPSSTVRHSSSAFPPTALRRCLRRRSAPSWKRCSQGICDLVRNRRALAQRAEGARAVLRRPAAFWEKFTAHAVANPDSDPAAADFERFVAEVAGRADKVEQGSVTLVGAGPGDPELLTLRAVRALQSADVILFDDLVSRDVLDFARREAKKMMVGKTGFGPSCKQEDINALMVALARQGKRVVRLKGGDPLIFARGGEEIAACAASRRSPSMSVPGITAAQGAASRLGISLTGRGQVRRLQYITGHARDGRLPQDIDWQSLADPNTTTAIYMPARTLVALIENAIEQGLDPQTPAIAIARATRPDQIVIADAASQLPSRLAAQNLPGARCWSCRPRARCGSRATRFPSYKQY